MVGCVRCEKCLWKNGSVCRIGNCFDKIFFFSTKQASSSISCLMCYRKTCLLAQDFSFPELYRRFGILLLQPRSKYLPIQTAVPSNNIFYDIFQKALGTEYQNGISVLCGVTTRNRSTTPLNTIIMFVPQQEVSSTLSSSFQVFRLMIQHCNEPLNSICNNILYSIQHHILYKKYR